MKRSFKKILEKIEDEMKDDFHNVKIVVDCDRVLTFWECTLVQCKWGDDESEGGVVMMGTGVGVGVVML